MNDLDMNIKDWYIKTYPSDLLGETLNDTTTFKDLNNLLDSGKDDIYKLLGGDADSVIRERIFEKLSEIEEVEYDEIYYRWLRMENDNAEMQI